MEEDDADEEQEVDDDGEEDAPVDVDVSHVTEQDLLANVSWSSRCADVTSKRVQLTPRDHQISLTRLFHVAATSDRCAHAMDGTILDPADRAGPTLLPAYEREIETDPNRYLSIRPRGHCVIDFGEKEAEFIKQRGCNTFLDLTRADKTCVIASQQMMRLYTFLFPSFTRIWTSATEFHDAVQQTRRENLDRLASLVSLLAAYRQRYPHIVVAAKLTYNDKYIAKGSDGVQRLPDFDRVIALLDSDPLLSITERKKLEKVQQWCDVTALGKGLYGQPDNVDWRGCFVVWTRVERAVSQLWPEEKGGGKTPSAAAFSNAMDPRGRGSGDEKKEMARREKRERDRLASLGEGVRL